MSPFGEVKVEVEKLRPVFRVERGGAVIVAGKVRHVSNKYNLNPSDELNDK